jgi:hypothetical protein
MPRTAGVPLSRCEAATAAELLDNAIEIGAFGRLARERKEIRAKLSRTGFRPLDDREIYELAVLLENAAHHDFSAAEHHAMARVQIKLRRAEPAGG